jgi:hypothetical protein
MRVTGLWLRRRVKGSFCPSAAGAIISALAEFTDMERSEGERCNIQAARNGGRAREWGVFERP